MHILEFLPDPKLKTRAFLYSSIFFFAFVETPFEQFFVEDLSPDYLFCSQVFVEVGWGLGS